MAENPYKQTIFVEDMVNKPYLKSSTLNHSMTIQKPYQKRMDMTNVKLVPVSKRKQFSKIQKMLPSITDESIIEKLIETKKNILYEEKFSPSKEDSSVRHS